MIHYVVLDPLSSDGWKPTQKVKGLVGGTDAESEYRLQTADARRSYEIPYENRTYAKWLGYRDFHLLRAGTTFGFLLWDLYSNYAENQRIGTGDGSTKTFQLAVTFADTATSVVRTIRFPIPAGTLMPYNVSGINAAIQADRTGTSPLDVAGATVATFVLTVGGSLQPASAYSVSASTGLVTFNSTPANGAAVVASFYYYTPVRFQSDTWDMTVNGVLGSSTPPLIEILGVETVVGAPS